MRQLFTFVTLMLIWCVFSGQFDAFHLSLGVISCLVVTLLCSHYLYSGNPPPMSKTLSVFARMIPYSLWLLKEIFLANVHVLRLALTPRGIRDVRPMFIKFKTQLRSPSARYLLANSITLTPGTVTLKLEENQVYVHSISAKTTIGLEGDMEKRIAYVFGEEITEKPEISAFK